MFVRVIIGRRGAGKTSLLTEMTDECVKKYNCCVVQTMTHIRCRDARIRYFWDYGEALRWAWENRPSVIFLDEYIVWRHKYTEDFDYVLHGGRNVDIGLVLNSQRPADIPPDIRSMTNTFYIFNLTEGNDLKWVEENIGPEYVPVIRALPPYKYVIYPPDEQGLPAPVMTQKRKKPKDEKRPDKPDRPGIRPDRAAGKEGGDKERDGNADLELEDI